MHASGQSGERAGRDQEQRGDPSLAGGTTSTVMGARRIRPVNPAGQSGVLPALAWGLPIPGLPFGPGGVWYRYRGSLRRYETFLEILIEPYAKIAALLAREYRVINPSMPGVPVSDEQEQEEAGHFQFSLVMSPKMFQGLFDDYLKNVLADSGVFAAKDVRATITPEVLSVDYATKSDQRAVSFTGTYSIEVIPEQYAEAFARIVNVKASARQMLKAGMSWNDALNAALNIPAARRGGWKE